jgi:signal transduction histidine kinase
MPSKRQEHIEADYLRTVFDTNPLPTFVVDDDLRILDFNTAGRALLGDSPESALLHRGGEVLHCINSEAKGCGKSAACSDCVIRRSVGQAFHGGKTYRALHQFVTRSPAGVRSAATLVTAAALRTKDTTQVLLILEDVEPWQRLTRELAERNREIESFYHTLSHELKTPLTVAREFVSIVADGLAGPVTESQVEYLGIARESCDQLRLYINDLLDATRLETGKMSIELRPASLVAQVTRVTKMLEPIAAAKGIALTCDCVPNLPDIPIDARRILQVLTNLTNNAVKFTPSGGQIQLRVSEAPDDPGCLRVSVRDTGKGIEKKHLELIFNRLYQVKDDPSRESRSGLGLGLFICRELVNLHKGRIWVESEPLRGSTFHFTVPKSCQP